MQVEEASKRELVLALNKINRTILELNKDVRELTEIIGRMRLDDE